MKAASCAAAARASFCLVISLTCLNCCCAGCWCAVLQGVDVASQAFSVFDPAKSGAADMATLKRFLKQLHSVEVGAQLHAEPALTGCRSLST
jgi:hypothetical protein